MRDASEQARRIGALIDLAAAADLAELDFSDASMRLRILRGAPAQRPAAEMGPGIAPEPAPAAEGGAAPGIVDESPEAPAAPGLRAPFGGVVYLAPAPGEAALVGLGQTVAPGQPLCILEAMKVLTTLVAETAGEIAEILVRDGEPVVEGQPLFRFG